MTEPGGATTVGEIIAYLKLDRSDFDTGIDGARAKANELGSASPNVRITANITDILAQLNAVIDAERRVAGKPDIQIKTNAAAATAQLAAVITAEDGIGDGAKKAQPFVVNLWAALAAVAPAAVPIAGVAGGALAGLIPVLATVSLATKGITADLKDGSLQASQYGGDITSIKTEISGLEQIAAGGILSGVDQGLAASHGLFGEVNSDVQDMSAQLGQIIAGAGPALLTILTDLNPLFETFGSVITRGADELESWAANSTGVSKFVTYVQAEMPVVLQTVGELVVLLEHLVEGAAPFGGVLLRDIDLFVGALDKIPVGVLQTAIPLAVSLYAAFKTYQGIAVIVNGVNKAIAAMKAPFVAVAASAAQSAAVQNAASLSLEAQAAREAVVVAEGKASEAAAAADAAVEIAASVEGTSSILAAGATAAAESAIEFAAAMQAEADAAIASAAKITASSDAAAAAAAGAGESASIGFGAMLGPVGAVVAGVGLLATTLVGSSHAAQQSAQEVNSLTDAIRADSGAIGENTSAYVANALQKSGALNAAKSLGLSLSEVTLAAEGNTTAYAAVYASLVSQSTAIKDYASANGGATDAQKKQLAAMETVNEAITGQSKNVGKAADAYRNESAAVSQNGSALTASATATVSATSTIKMLTAAVLALGQTQIAAAQSEDQLKEGLLGITAAVKQNGDSLSQNTKGGLANRDMLLSLLQGAQSVAAAQQKNGESLDKVSSSLEANVKQIENTATAAGLSRTQVDALVKAMGLTPKDISTTFNLNTADALGKAQSLSSYLKSHFGGSITETVYLAEVTKKATSLPSNMPGHAAGAKGVPDGWFTANEAGPELFHKSGSQLDIYSNKDSKAIIAATGMITPGFAGGTGSSVPPSLTTTTTISTLVSSLGINVTKELISAIQVLTKGVNASVTATIEAKNASLASVKASAVGTVNAGIEQAVAPAPTTDQAIATLGGQISQAVTRQQQTLIAAANYNTLAAALAKTQAADKAAEAASKARVATLKDEGKNATAAAKSASDANTKLIAADNTREAALKKTADAAKTAYTSMSDEAKTAAQTAQATAKALVDSVTSTTNSILSQVQGFESSLQSGIAGGDTLTSLWQQLTGTDANGNPLTPSLTGLQSNLDSILSQTQKFSTDLTQITAEGGSQDLITQLTAMGSQAGDALASQLLAAGPAAIDALQTTMASIQSVATTEADSLAQSFYGPGIAAADAFISGLTKEFPQLKTPLNALIAQLNSLFKASTGGNASTLPSFASGVTNFAGGVALVHQGEALVNMPRGTDVITASKVKAMGATDNTALLNEVRALRADVHAAAKGNADALTNGIGDKLSKASDKSDWRIRSLLARGVGQSVGLR